MNQIEIGEAILENRKKKKVTQEELASFMGVSKAAVSKWETAQSYPDVELLPQLAAYFDISIDELMRYKPQMTKEDIKKTYMELSKTFSSESFDAAYKKWKKIVKKYYSCYPLLYQMGILLVNYSLKILEEEKKNKVLTEMYELFKRIENESQDAELINGSINARAGCCMMLGDAYGVIELLKDRTAPLVSDETMLAGAYAMIGEKEKARKAIQIKVYQYLAAILSDLQSMLMLYLEDEERFEETIRRACGLAEIFRINKVHPWTVVSLYLCGASGFVSQGKCEKAIGLLKCYTDVVTQEMFPLLLHGDEYFDLIDDWINELDLGGNAPRDEVSVKNDCCDQILAPQFDALSGMEEFELIKKRLLRFKERGE